MRTRSWSTALALAGGVLVSAAWAGSVEQSRVRAGGAATADAVDAAVDAYIYGYPLVTVDQTRRVMTNVARPDPTKLRAPVNQLVSAPAYPPANLKTVTAPNADTLYSSAFLDLSREPQVLHVPAMGDRYFLMPVLDGWTNVIVSPGTRTGVKRATDFVITGPNWTGDLPPGVQRIASPTNLAWIIGRIYCDGTPADLDAVHELQAQLSLKPLSSFGQRYTPAPAPVLTSVDMKTPTRDQVDNLGGEAFFTRLAELLKSNPPQPADARMLGQLSKIGITPGQDFAPRELDPALRRALANVPETALRKIKAQLSSPDSVTVVHGWEYPTRTGRYGDDFLDRAFIAWYGLGANLPDDAIYPVAHRDGVGQPLDGSKQYLLHFAKGQTPPVNGFWSLTMYDHEMFFVQNALDKHTVSPRNPMQYNADGSLDIYLQSESPGIARQANWLPAPRGPFVAMFRFYWPKRAIIDRSWQPPAILAAPM